MKDVFKRIRGFKMTDYVSKSKTEIRTALTGVYYDPTGYEVATDSYILVWRKMEVPDDLSGKLMLPNGGVVERSVFNYPNWKSIVPLHKKGLPEFFLDFDKLNYFAADWKENKEGKTIGIVKIAGHYFNIDRVMLFIKAMKYAVEDTCYIKESKEMATAQIGFGSMDGMGGLLQSYTQSESCSWKVYKL